MKIEKYKNGYMASQGGVNLAWGFTMVEAIIKGSFFFFTRKCDGKHNDVASIIECKACDACLTLIDQMAK